MGNGGKVREQQRARELRAEAWTLAAIAAELGVAKSSVSLWVRDVEFVPRPCNRGHRSQRPHPLHVAKLAEIEAMDGAGLAAVGRLTERELLLVGAALYLGEGFKTSGIVGMANTDPAVLRTYVLWLRRCFGVDENRLRVRLYLHQGLDESAATAFWSELLDIPPAQFGKSYRAVADPSRRRAKHVFGCPAVTYADCHLQRRVMGLVRAITSQTALPG
jgi:hypothetical protein